MFCAKKKYTGKQNILQYARVSTTTTQAEAKDLTFFAGARFNFER